jgi:hypothetical protein
MMPLGLPLSWLLTPLLAIAMSAVSYWAGDHNRNNAHLALQATAQMQANAALLAAQVRGDRLSTRLLSAEHQINQQRGELNHALNQATTGRPCLGAAALRLLNQAPGISVDQLPTAPSGAVATGASLASDSGDSTAPASTDTQVASWIADAGSAFEVCRTRLDALIEWHLERQTP